VEWEQNHGARRSRSCTNGKPANDASFRQAAEAALQGAKAQSENRFKIELAKRCLTHALRTAAA
jgi:xanthine dehydrogenase YagS FAD-binding subunit